MQTALKQSSFFLVKIYTKYIGIRLFVVVKFLDTFFL